MIAGLATLLCCQLIGEALARWLSLPVPGPVIGMALLFFALLLRGALPVGVVAGDDAAGHR
jgi:holin-like protein